MTQIIFDPNTLRQPKLLRLSRALRQTLCRLFLC